MLQRKTATRAAFLLLLAACTGDGSPLAPVPAGPGLDISDAAHAGAVKGFYFLPPMVPQPTYTGTFDAGLAPRVEICELSGTACGPVIAQYTMTSGSGSEVVRVSATSQSYAVNWHTDAFDLDVTKNYRISVFVGSFRLGFAEVDPVGSGKELKNVDTQEYIPLLDGRTLPIKFRIETGIVGAVAVSPATTTIQTGQTQQFTAALTDLHGNPITAPVTWSSSSTAVATVDGTGLATGVAAGTATITATSGGAAGSATLTVEEPNTPPTSVADAFEAIGNVTVPVAAPGVLANDTDPDNDALSVATPGTYPTANGGTVTLAADGSFTYLSPAGFTGTDSFSYAATDGIAASGPVTVTMTVGSRVWYVRNDAGAPGDGRDASPFATLKAAESASAAGENIFVLAGNGTTAGYGEGIVLKTGQSLTGQGVSGDIMATLNGQPVVLLSAGSAPQITRSDAGATVQLATNNTVQGVSVASTAGAGIAGSGFGTFTAGSLSVSAVGGPGVDLENGSASASFIRLSSNGSSATGLRLIAVTGSLQVTGDGTAAASGGTIQGAAGNAVTLSASANVHLALMRILPTSNGIVATNYSGTLVVERSTIDYQNTAPAGSYAVRLENASTNGALTLDASTVQNKADATAAVAVSARGTSSILFSVVDSNPADGFESRFTNLFGSAVVSIAGDDVGSTAKVTTNVSNTRFVNAAVNGINNLEITANHGGVADFNVSGNTFDAVGRPSAIVGVINIQAVDQGRLGSGVVAANLIRNLGVSSAASGYLGLRVVADNSVSGLAHNVTVQGNTFENIWRQAILVSSRGSADDMDLRIDANTIGTAAAPVGRSNRRGVEIEAQSTSQLDVEVTGNPSIVGASTSGGNSALHFRSIGTGSRINATVLGNTIGNTNAATADGRFRAETLAGSTASLCLDLRNNALDGAAKTFDVVNAGTGTYTVEGPGTATVTSADITAQNTAGTGNVSGTVTFSNGQNCQQPSL